MEMLTSAVKRILPQSVFQILQLPYHYLLAFFGAVVFGFPSRKIQVVAVTGTKGKSSVVELTSAILEEAGFATALANTIRFKIRDDSRPNTYKMTMPGRFFLQHFLRKAVRAGCTHAVIEMTSEGARQFRHRFIALDALIFTNLAPEHLESHGSYENYIAAKVSLAHALEKSPLKKGETRILGALQDLEHPSSDAKGVQLRYGVPESARGRAIPPNKGGSGGVTTPASTPTTSSRRLNTPPPTGDRRSAPLDKGDKILVVNGDDKEAQKFLDVFSGTKVVYSKRDVMNSVISSEGVSFDWGGSLKSDFNDSVRIESKLPGEFNLYNILAAVSYAKAAGIPIEKIQAGIEKVKSIRGRAERITLENSTTPPYGHPSSTEEGRLLPDFTVIVDYAHTPDSLEKLYQTYAGKYRICVLGNAGGGRDRWKRPVMAGIAEKYCDEVILTNEDPYDEDPEQIIREMAAGMGNNPRTSECVAPFIKGDDNPPGQPPLVGGITTPAHQNVSPPLLRGIQPTLILARRAAIRAALQKASKGDVVLITGKGTDPYIMGPHGTKEPWDDAAVAREELAKILAQRNS